MAIMIDLETLDTESNALVVSLGAVHFDPKGQLNDIFRANFQMKEQMKRGRTISPDTVSWWMKQSDEARKSSFSELERESVADALFRFNEFAKERTQDGMWGNGADFDCVILGNLYAAYGLVKPWSYSKNRCFRTMRNLFQHTVKGFVYEGVDHDPVADAVNQARYLQEIFKCNIHLSP